MTNHRSEPVRTNDPELIALLKKHEGVELFPYKDSVGILTIGCGHNLEASGIPMEIADLLLSYDLEIVVRELPNHFPDFTTYSRNRQMALIDMAFNLGVQRLLKFKNMVIAILSGDWDKAASEALDSYWSKQVGPRATELAEMLRAG